MRVRRRTAVALLVAVASCSGNAAARREPASPRAEPPVESPPASVESPPPVEPPAAPPTPIAAAPAEPTAAKFAVDLGGGVKMEFVLVRPGVFTMGDKITDGPPHEVTITKPFYLAKFETTQEQWGRLMSWTPSRVRGPKNPVERVSWDECHAFLGKLNALVRGPAFVLPTEAQWEFACRAGTTTTWPCGDDAAGLGDIAWLDANSGGTTHPVGGKQPNAWGLCDMIGNVAEWCEDSLHPYSPAAAVDPVCGPVSGVPKMFRGAAFDDSIGRARCAYRLYGDGFGRWPTVGFRVARRVDESAAGATSATAPAPSRK